VTLKALREDRPFQGFILRAVEVPAIRGPMELEPLPIGSFQSVEYYINYAWKLIRVIRNLCFIFLQSRTRM